MGTSWTIQCDAVLFDMDGTLVDSHEVVERQWRLWGARHGVDPEKILAVSHGRRSLETMREVAPHLTFDEEDARRFDEEEAKDREGLVAVEGALALLASLPTERWAVVTSATQHLAKIRMGCAGIHSVPVLVGADDVREGKPNPEGYLLAARLLGMRPDRCLVVEDTPAGLAAGVAAGMQVLAIGKTFPREVLLADEWIPHFRNVRVSLGTAPSITLQSEPRP